MAFTLFREASKKDGVPGDLSLRRVLAAFFAVAGIAAGVVALVNGAEWKTAAVAFGVPVLAVLALLFFTTWSDVAAIAAIFRRKDE
jgi:hypothetical protein